MKATLPFALAFWILLLGAVAWLVLAAIAFGLSRLLGW